MCKKLFLLTSFVLVLGSGAGQTWGAYRAAYWDADFAQNWIDEPVTIEMRDYFADAGYEILDADQLKEWMDARIADGKISVVVFCKDFAPETVCETNTADCTLRKYLDAGGKIVFHSDIPFWKQAIRGGDTILWKDNGAIGILGFTAVGPGSIRNSYDDVTFTAKGMEWGLTETWESRRPADASVAADENLTVLATDNAGHAAAWVKHYVPGDTARGFVRVFDTRDSPKLNFDDLKRLAEYGLTDPELAGNPSPPNKTTDIPRDGLVLSWTPGEFAEGLSPIHRVFFSDDFNDVNDSIGGVTQNANDYPVPSLLDFGKTYYWRVDEVDGAQDNTILKGEVWSFTVEPMGCPLAGELITASCWDIDDTDANDTVNGSGLGNNDLHSTDTSDMWLSSPAEPNQAWLQYDFGQPRKLHQMLVWNYNGDGVDRIFGIKEARIEHSLDGVNWTALDNVPAFAQAPGTDDYAANITVDFNGVVVTQVRVTALSNWAGGIPPFDQYGLSEVRFLYIPMRARELSPTAGSTDVDPAAVLTWRTGRAASVHEVYLGSDPNNLSLRDTGAGSPYGTYDTTPLDLQLGQTYYYWRIDEVNDLEDPAVWEGEVWSFSTSAVLTVDDFEGYTDDWENEEAIWEVWIDGLTDPAKGGSMVGYAEAPFAEQEIVHSGRQAMPISYSNTNGVSYSEATRTFDVPQDWAAHGIKSLSLYFQGLPDNGGRLYLKINNTLVPYNGDAADLTKTIWQPWNIDLLNVAADLANVRTLTIGIEGTGATGIVYIDDICLYPRTPEYITPVEPGSAQLLAQYDFEGNANDSSGNGLHGTLKQAVLVNSGRPGAGSAVELNQVGYVDLGNPGALDFGTEDWTVTAWFKTAMTGTGDANKGAIYAKGGDSGGGHRYALIVSENEEGVVSLICDDDATKIVTDSTSAVNDDRWHFVAGQRDGTALRIFIDGQEEGTSTAAADYNLSGTSQHNAYIGAITNHGDGSLYKQFNGLVDEVRVYNRALSAGEILWLAGQTAPVAKPF